MPSILNAIIKGLSTAAGPFGFPGEIYLRYRDEYLGEIHAVELEKIISEGHSISRETLEEIFEIKNEMKEFREQLINGIIGINEVLSMNKISIANHQTLDKEISSLISDHLEIFNKSGFVTEEVLLNELSSLYADDPSQFIQIIDFAGFNIARIPHGKNTAFSITLFHFLKESQRRYKLEKQAKIFAKLTEDNPNSNPIRVYRNLLNERLLENEK
jgi:hypothetical protein